MGSASWPTPHQATVKAYAPVGSGVLFGPELAQAHGNGSTSQLCVSPRDGRAEGNSREFGVYDIAVLGVGARDGPATTATPGQWHLNFRNTASLKLPFRPERTSSPAAAAGETLNPVFHVMPPQSGATSGSAVFANRVRNCANSTSLIKSDVQPDSNNTQRQKG
jgi:hypothetical protein